MAKSNTKARGERIEAKAKELKAKTEQHLQEEIPDSFPAYFTWIPYCQERRR
jgi:hypothetical protein